MGNYGLIKEIRLVRKTSECSKFQQVEHFASLNRLGRGEIIGPQATIRKLVESLSRGQAVELQIDDLPAMQYRFRPVKVTTEDFGFTDGVNNPIPMDYKAFQGRAMSPVDNQIQRVTAAVVADKAVFAITQEGRDFLVEMNTQTQELSVEEMTPSAPEPHSEGHDASFAQCASCTIDSDGMAIMKLT